MKKKIIFILVLMIFITGCEKKTEEKKYDWTINEEPEVVISIPENAINAFNKAYDDFTGMALKPIVLLGTQVVAGTNYRFLCTATTVTGERVTNWRVVTVYSDLEGNNTITDIYNFDINDNLNKTTSVNKTGSSTGSWKIYIDSELDILTFKLTEIYNNVSFESSSKKYIPLVELGSSKKVLSVLAIENNDQIVIQSIDTSKKDKYKLLKTSYISLSELSN